MPLTRMALYAAWTAAAVATCYMVRRLGAMSWRRALRSGSDGAGVFLSCGYVLMVVPRWPGAATALLVPWSVSFAFGLVVLKRSSGLPTALAAFAMTPLLVCGALVAALVAP